jgi:RNA polymerase sigma-70 factor, ECF subfamily
MGRRGSEVIDGSPGFDDLYRREIVPLATLGAALTGSRESGADLAHEALLRAYRAWPEVSALDRPGAWVRRVLINLASDVRRRGGRERRALGRMASRQATASPIDVDDSFWAAVRALPERQRAAVALHYVDDLSIDGIADVLGVTSGTVKASLFAARRSLAATLGAQEVDG